MKQYKNSFPIDILASLARMNEKRASVLLCKFYDSTKNRTDYRYVFIAESMAFSLDSVVMECLIDDFKSIDPAIKFSQGDSGYWPSWILGEQIIAALKFYVQKKFIGIDYFEPHKLRDWLDNPANSHDLVEK
jgi:hypothetical protein